MFHLLASISLKTFKFCYFLLFLINYAKHFLKALESFLANRFIFKASEFLIVELNENIDIYFNVICRVQCFHHPLEQNVFLLGNKRFLYKWFPQVLQQVKGYTWIRLFRCFLND